MGSLTRAENTNYVTNYLPAVTHTENSEDTIVLHIDSMSVSKASLRLKAREGTATHTSHLSRMEILTII